MVKIAIAGGSGEVAREVLEILVALKKHEIILLSRNAAVPVSKNPFNLQCVQVDYTDVNSLTEALRGTHTLLSFVQLIHDPESKSQKVLVDAAVAAGVTRFAPSEYGSRFAGPNMPFNSGKDRAKEYLRSINLDHKVLEYTLFQPGFFMNYLATPHQTAKHLTPLNFIVDFERRRAIMIEDHDPVIVLTTVQDTAAVVTAAVDYEGQWPEVSGIQGHRITLSKLIKIGERVRGSPFDVHTVKLEDLQAGKLISPWGLESTHPSVSEREAAKMLEKVLIGILLTCEEGAWDVSDEWNRLLPGHRFTKIEDHVGGLWP